jgi:hypothetical protein
VWGGEGKVEGRYKEERRPLHSFEIRSNCVGIFLNLWPNFLPLTNGPKKKTKDGRTKDATYFLGISFYSCDWRIRLWSLGHPHYPWTAHYVLNTHVSSCCHLRPCLGCLLLSLLLLLVVLLWASVFHETHQLLLAQEPLCQAPVLGPAISHRYGAPVSLKYFFRFEVKRSEIGPVSLSFRMLKRKRKTTFFASFRFVSLQIFRFVLLHQLLFRLKFSLIFK